MKNKEKYVTINLGVFMSDCRLNAYVWCRIIKEKLDYINCLRTIVTQIREDMELVLEKNCYEELEKKFENFFNRKKSYDVRHNTSMKLTAMLRERDSLIQKKLKEAEKEFYKILIELKQSECLDRYIDTIKPGFYYNYDKECRCEYDKKRFPFESYFKICLDYLPELLNETHFEIILRKSGLK